MLAIIIVLIAFIIVTICVGLYFRDKTNTVSDFVLGGRGVGPWITAFAYGTSYFSAVVFVGYAGQFGWNFGLAATWIGIGNAFLGSLAPWLIMGRRTRIMTHHLESSTMPEFLQRRFDSNLIKIISAIIVFIFLIPYTASVYNGLSRLFEMALSIPYSVCLFSMAALTAVYVILGGYKATAYNDFFQGIVMIIGISAIIFAVLNQNNGLFESVNILSQKEHNGITGEFTKIWGPDPINLIGVIILTSLGTWGLPQMVHKFYAIKDDKSIFAGAIVSTVFAIIIAGGCYFLGGFGRLFVNPNDAGLPIGKYDNIIPTMMGNLPEILLGITIVMVLSASMSTLSSLVLTSSSTLTLDLIRPALEKNGKVKESFVILIMRILIAFFLLCSVIMALNKNALIADMMGYSWGALAGSFLAPALYGIFWKRITKTAVYCNFIFAVGGTILHFIFRPSLSIGGFSLASPVNLGGTIMVLSLVLVPIISLCSKKPDETHIESVFSCYKK